MKLNWTKKKPEFNKEFLLLTANFIRDHWEYSLWEIMKVDGPDGWYYGLCEPDGEEWGDSDDLETDLYCVLPKKRNPKQKSDQPPVPKGH